MGYIKIVSKVHFGIMALVVLHKSKLEFASLIWDPHPQNYIDDNKSVQKQCFYVVKRLVTRIKFCLITLGRVV